MKNIIKLVCFLLITAKVSAQVNLQTGSSVFSLPMFQWQDNKSRLTSIVALNYNSENGLKVNSLASNVGQGWNLLSGGVVSRIQVGLPDDQKAYYYDKDNGAVEKDNDLTKYPAGYMYASMPAYYGSPEALTKYPLYRAKNIVYRQHNIVAEDRELDYFSFRFNGKSGMFVIDPINMIGRPIGDTKMKITFQVDFTMANTTSSGIRTTITSFTIQDVDGLVYTFAKHGMSKVLDMHFCDEEASRKLHQPTFKDHHIYYKAGFPNPDYVNPWVINNWYLSKIKDPLTGREIQFHYNTLNLNDLAGTSIFYNKGDKKYIIISYKRSITQTPEINSIVYPDGHTVYFNYSSVQRADFPGKYALASVDVKYQGRYLSRYQLNTTYFILNRYGTPVSDYEKSTSRLCLKSVRKIGVDLKEESPPYIFDYNLGSSGSDDFVPPPFFYAKDIWGYYNGDASIGYNSSPVPLHTTIKHLTFDQLRGLCFLRASTSEPALNPKPGYARNGLLKQIIYPTGGTLTYKYSQNRGTFSTGGQEQNVGGVHVSQTESTDGGFRNGCDDPLITYYNYVLDNGSSSFWGLEMPVNDRTVHTHYAPERRQFRGWTLSCYWYYQYPGIQSQFQSINLSLLQQIAASPVLGGISLLLDVLDVAKYISLESGLGFIFVDAIGIIVNIIFSCTGDDAHDYTTTVYYNTNLNGINPLPTQFKRVEVVREGGGAGKTIQTFTSNEDYPLWVPAGDNPMHSSRQRYAPWAYGLPKMTSIYDSIGRLVKQVENVYDTIFAKTAADGPWPGHGPISYFCMYYPEICDKTGGLHTRLVSCHYEVLKTFSQRITNWSRASQSKGDGGYDDSASYYNETHPAPPDLMNVKFYGMYTGRMLLDTTYKRVYDLNNPAQYAQTETEYYYNDGRSRLVSSNGPYIENNYEVKRIETHQSDGSIYIKYFKYTTDYDDTTSALYSLVQNNLVSVPVETKTAIIESGDRYLNEQVTEYTQLSNGNIKPLRILEQRFTQPQANFTEYEGPGSDVSNYHVVQKYTYDNSGNVIGMQDEGMHNITNIYGYNDKYIIATVINASPLIDKPAYTSFETDGELTVPGGWTRNGAPVYSSTSITGKRSLSLSSGKSLTASLNTGKAYILSFWATHSLSVSSDATLKKSGPTYNGFTYYEYSINAGISSITVSGTGNIDELRLYPQKARMQTTTYDPLIGKTSVCDESNRITYYTYDNLGRLRFVKDENKKIVKMYEYNNVSIAKRRGCPATFSNHKITEVFTKNNCTAGTMPDTNQYSYTVPAGKYTSSVSQADADAQAQTELLTHGQAQANANNSCIAIYYNTAVSITDSSQSCAVGEKGGFVTYTVPAGVYSSLISQADANAKATEEAQANAQWYANSPGHKACMVDNSPDWEWEEGEPTDCRIISGDSYKFLLMTDENPNSNTYNQTQWVNTMEQGDCPTVVKLSIFNYTGDSTLTINLINENTGEEYSYSEDPEDENHTYNYIHVPAGTYEIYISLVGNCGHYYTGTAACYYTISGTECTQYGMYDVEITSECNTIELYSDDD